MRHRGGQGLPRPATEDRRRGVQIPGVGVLVAVALLTAGVGTVLAGPGEQYKPCYWQNSGCAKGDILGFGTKNSGFYDYSTGLATSGVSGRSKGLRVKRGSTFYGWWFSTSAYHDVSFGGVNTQQHWCGNNTSTPQLMWCDMWLNGF